MLLLYTSFVDFVLKLLPAVNSVRLIMESQCNSYYLTSFLYCGNCMRSKYIHIVSLQSILLCIPAAGVESSASVH